MSLRNGLLSDVLCESRVHLYVSGHDHNLQHLNAVPEYFSCAIHQLISGAGGATFRDIHPNLKGKGLLFAKKMRGLALLAADSETLSLEIFETQAGLTPTYRYDIKP